ncbi:hypothetical protein SAMN05880570_4493 [Paenibacillus sp. RU4T]|nr:hypothetical protein SAMN05880555_4491 [Paenibacillus sp. RU4X]SIR71467.1 hypothetical protein SAMN05880570_4493 [Paenibacillus sp. RU4T]
MKKTDDGMIQPLPEKAVPFMEEQGGAGPAIPASIGSLPEHASAQAAKRNAQPPFTEKIYRIGEWIR